MKKISVGDVEYEFVTNYKNAFDEEEFLARCTDYFLPYDYIVGDIAYSKLRLKGFYDSNNKKKNKINDYKNVSSYLQTRCANDCKYFILRKVR